jgi:REP element-mobilizing transposase RayT
MLFEELEDYQVFLDYLCKLKEEFAFDVYAYCLMDNHVHIFLQEQQGGNLSVIMKRLLTYYVGWFNRKYERSGGLIANRYRSQCIEDEAYLLELMRYIHQNPVKVGLALDYPWSSYGEYLGMRKGPVTTAFGLALFSHDKKGALSAFKEFHGVLGDESFGITSGKRRDAGLIRREIMRILGGTEPHTLAALPKAQRDALLTSLKAQGFSVRELERATGISRGVIQNSDKGRRAGG